MLKAELLDLIGDFDDTDEIVLGFVGGNNRDDDYFEIATVRKNEYDQIVIDSE